MTFYRLKNDRVGFVACFSPKCGCTTLKNWFVHSLQTEKTPALPGKKTGERELIEERTISVDEIDTHDDYLRILFIRDPFRRLVSFYCNYVVRDNRLWCFADDNKEHSLHGKSFSSFIQTLRALAAQGVPFQHHLQPQVQDVRQIAFDFVIPVEDLDAQLFALNARLGIDYDVPRLHATPYDEKIDRYVYDIDPGKLSNEGVPGHRYFFNQHLVDVVKEIYLPDQAYYRALFDRHSLFHASEDRSSVSHEQ